MLFFTINQMLEILECNIPNKKNNDDYHVTFSDNHLQIGDYETNLTYRNLKSEHRLDKPLSLLEIKRFNTLDRKAKGTVLTPIENAEFEALIEIKRHFENYPPPSGSIHHEIY